MMFKKMITLTIAILIIWIAALVMNYFFNYFQSEGDCGGRQGCDH